MNSRRKIAKRVYRPLTDDEQARLARARRETEAEREEILRLGRAARRAWEASRGHPSQNPEDEDPC